MNICKPLPTVLVRARLASGMSQASLCAATGIAPPVLSRAESGRRVPSERTLRTLCRALDLSFEHVRDATGWEPPRTGVQLTRSRTLLEREFGSLSRYVPPGERTFAERLYKCRHTYGLLASGLEARVDRRPDRKELERRLADLPSGSATEVLFVLHVLALGACCDWLSPLRLGFADPRVLDRKTGLYVAPCLMPGLSLRADSLSAVFFPQLPLRTDTFGPVSLDFLVGVRHQGDTAWRNLEIDGNGHNPTDDDERDKAVGLGTVRFRDADLRAREFQTKLVESLVGFADLARKQRLRRALG